MDKLKAILIQHKKTLIVVTIVVLASSLLFVVKPREKTNDSPVETIGLPVSDDEAKTDDDKPAKKKAASKNTGESTTDTTAGSGSSTSSKTKSSSSSKTSSDSEEETVPDSTLETRSGQPLEDFPFPIMTDPPHSVHDPVTDFASTTTGPGGSYTFTLPGTTNDIGLYGQFWLSPTLPTSNAKLVGIRITNTVSSGTMDNSLAVFSLLDRNTEDNALGSVTGAYQGLANQLVAVVFDSTPTDIELRLTTPLSNSSGRFVFVIDSENLPTSNPTTYPTSISVGKIEWLWSAP